MAYLQNTADIPYSYTKTEKVDGKNNIPKHKTAPYAKITSMINGLNRDPQNHPIMMNNKTHNMTSSQRSRKLTDNDSIIQDYIKDSGLISQIKAQEKNINGSSVQKFSISPSPRAISMGNKLNYHPKSNVITNLNALSHVNQIISPTNFESSKFPVYQAPYKKIPAQDISFNSTNQKSILNSSKKTDIINFHISNDLKPFIRNVKYQRDSGYKLKLPKLSNKENLSDRTHKSIHGSGKKPSFKAKNFEKEIDELNRSLTKLKNDLLLNKESPINQFMRINKNQK